MAKEQRVTPHFERQTRIAWVVTLLVIALPLIRYDGIHLLLFNFYHNRFELFFQTCEVDTGYLTAVFILMATGVILLFNFTYSRYFCGHFCPKTLLKRLFIDFIQAKLFRILRMRDRHKKEKIAMHVFKAFLSYLLLLLLCAVSAWAFFLYLIPAEVLVDMTRHGFAKHPFIAYTLGSIALYLFAEALYFKEFFCSYVCPFQLVSSVSVIEARSAYTFYNPQHCTECSACVRICPVPDLDIKKGFDTRCISCGDCSAVCTEVMEHNGNPGLIDYRTRTGRPNTRPLFSFAGPERSLVLSLLALLIVGALIAYLLAAENLDQCRFINAGLYR